MVAPQQVSNGYVQSNNGGVLRFHHGKMTSSYHVRQRQDKYRNQKESYQTGTISNPLNRYSRKIGHGAGIEKKKQSQLPDTEVIEIDDGVNPDVEVGPAIPDGGAHGAASALWSYFMPLNSFTCKCNRCHLVLNLPSSENTKLGSSSSPMVQHLMKCLETAEYKEFIHKRETRYDNEKKELDKQKREEVELSLKKGPLLTSVVKGAPIWCLFRQMKTFLPNGLPDSDFATCMIKDCFKVVRIVRQSASAMILHLADDHVKFHDLYLENHKKTSKELRKLIQDQENEEDRLLKSEKADKLAQKQKENINPNSISKRKSSYEEDEKTTNEYENFNNSNSTLRDYFVPLGMLYAKCKSCHTTLSVEVSFNRSMVLSLSTIWGHWYFIKYPKAPI